MQKIFYSLGVALLCVLIYVYVKHDPGLSYLFPKCPFHTLTGYDCPGCGTQRAIHALLNGRFLAAMDYNFLMVLSLPLLAANFSLTCYSWVSGKTRQLNFLHYPSTPIVVGAVVIVFWIVRNIPFFPFSYLKA